MAVLNIEKSFLTENRSVLDFLNQSGQGLYIPLYQVIIVGIVIILNNYSKI